MADEIREKSEAQIWWESDLNLYNACNWIEENYATPEECFSIFAQQGRRDYNSFIVAVGQGHDRATLVWYRLNTAFDKWMVESRKKVLDSDDQKAKTILLKFLQTGKFQKIYIPKKVQRLIDAQNYIDFRKW